jgi:hypothetical protein
VKALGPLHWPKWDKEGGHFFEMREVEDVA